MRRSWREPLSAVPGLRVYADLGDLWKGLTKLELNGLSNVVYPGNGKFGREGAMQSHHHVASHLMSFNGMAVEHALGFAGQLLQLLLHGEMIQAEFVSGFHRHHEGFEVYIHLVNLR